MTILLYLILLGGLLVFLSQSSYAYVIAKVDVSTSERRVHCAHHTVHSVCAILVMLLAIALLKGDCQPLTNVACAIAGALLVVDAVVFIVLNKVKQFAVRRDAIRHKWAGEKVFGPEHDREVSEYRVLKEITNKNLLRDGLHLLLFVALFLISFIY